ncbi:MAG: phytoene/squalene synthase family protein [Elusimicrobiota bacterium]
MDAGVQDLLKRVSRSMYLSLRVLPDGVRDAMGLGYLFCRAADTIADTRLVPRAQRLATLEAYRAAFETGRPVEAALLDGYTEHQASAAERELLERLNDCVALWRSFPAAERELLKEVVFGVIDGMRLDFAHFPGDSVERISALPNAALLDEYCGFIGGAPGLFWTKLCLLRVPKLKDADAGMLLDRGYRLGKGLQITNILRDIPGDLRIGRCYLPQEELDAAGLKVRDLLEPAALPKLRPVVRAWLRWGLEHLSAGADYVEAMPGMRLRAAVAWPSLLAVKTLLGIHRSEKLLEEGRAFRVAQREVNWMLVGSPWTLSSNERFRRKFEALRSELAAAL